MDLRHMRFFIAVAEDLNFTRAAERLRVAQPHLSREVRHLEEEIGAPLITRGRKVALTPAGVAFLDQARKVLADVAEAVQAAQRAHRGETGRLRVGFSSSAGFGLLPDAVRRYREAWPDVEVILTEFNSDEQLDLVRRDMIDVSLLYPPRHVGPALKVETLLADPLVAALPEGHALAGRDVIPLELLAAEPWIFFRRAVASCLHDTIMTACNDAGFAPRVVQEALKLSTIANLVASGLGVTLVPDNLARILLYRAVCRPLAAPAPEVPLAAMWRRGDRNPALSAFLDTVRGEVVRIAAREDAAC